MLLEIPFALARSSGLLLRYEKHSRWYLLLTILIVLNTVNFIVPIGYFMILHLDSLDNFTNSFGAFSNMVVNVLKTLMFLSANENLAMMMNNLESITADKNRSNYAVSAIANHKTDEYTKKFLVVVYISVFGITFAPLLAMALEYYNTGDLVKTSKELPFKSA